MNVLFIIISCFLFFYAPQEFSLNFCILITVLFFIQAVFFVKKKSNGNYVNFYTPFLISFYFINFFYPTVIYPIDPQFFSIFSVPFNENYINKGTALALVCISTFIFGSSLIKFPYLKGPQHFKFNLHYNYKRVAIITLIFFILFIGTVGKDFLSGNFVEKSSISLYILQIISCLFVLTPILFFKYYNFIQNRILFWIVSAGYILLFLMIGDRGPALSLILLCVGLYTFYITKIPNKYLITLGFGGMLLMHLIGLGRTANSNAEGNIISRGVSNFNPESYLEITRGFVVNTRNLYVGLEYVSNEGINWGTTSLFNALMSIIPFSQSLFQEAFNFEFNTSAYFFTRLAFGTNAGYGLGTNLIADVYISFGFLGCLILFFIFGLLIEYFRKRTFLRGDMFSCIIYFTLFSYALYYPRTGLFMPLKFILWTYFIYLVLKALKILKPFESKVKYF